MKNRNTKHYVHTRTFFSIEVVVFDDGKPVMGRIMKARDLQHLYNVQKRAKGWAKSKIEYREYATQEVGCFTYKIQTSIGINKY